MTIDFLSIDDVLRLHALSARRYGGADGVRDRGLLEAAVMAPLTELTLSVAQSELSREEVAARLERVILLSP